MVAALGAVLLFLFVPETFWDRTPVSRPRRPNFIRRVSSRISGHHHHHTPEATRQLNAEERVVPPGPAAALEASARKDDGHADHDAHKHVGFAPEIEASVSETPGTPRQGPSSLANHGTEGIYTTSHQRGRPASATSSAVSMGNANPQFDVEKRAASPVHNDLPDGYTPKLRQMPAMSFKQQLKPFSGRLSNDKWLKVMTRPLILFLYPSILWSAAVLSTGEVARSLHAVVLVAVPAAVVPKRCPPKLHPPSRAPAIPA